MKSHKSAISFQEIKSIEKCFRAILNPALALNCHCPITRLLAKASEMHDVHIMKIFIHD